MLLNTPKINIKPNDNYGLKLLVMLSLLMFLLAYASFYLIQNYYANTFLDATYGKKKIYFLESPTTKNMYARNNMDYETFQEHLKMIQQMVQKNNFKTQIISINDLATIEKKSTVIGLDLMSLTQDEINKIDHFVTQGGSFLFNFTAGFLNKSLVYQEKNLVTSITPLHLDPNINTIRYKKDSEGYLSTRIGSYVSKYLPQGLANYLAVYDPIPIFQTPNSMEADAYLTNWSQTSYLNITPAQELTKSQSGLMWHGYKGKGKWIYFSFPSYVLLDSTQHAYTNLLKGMLYFLTTDIIVQPYPYIDYSNGVFVSEDTEYKYENILKFYNASKKYNFPVTAFCVANLAKKNQDLMKIVSKDNLFEIGSHSYTHKKIVGESDQVYKRETIGSKILLDQLSNQNIIGFRAPREEIDEKMIKLLQRGGFKYIFSEAENKLTPYFQENILIIPKHATDDYSYLINLDWSASQVLESMKHQVNVVASLNGLYSMSTHTHLMIFGDNVKIIEKFFAYINQNKDLHPMNGSMIYKRMLLKKHLSLTTKQTAKKLVITISNNNNEVVKNLHLEIQHSPTLLMQNVDSEIIGVRTQLKQKNKSCSIISIKTIKPKSQLVLFVNYAQTH